ncbi:hypothetical protein D7231_24435 [Streptomyces klenkii]|uniref:Uncharacterized protein n=1 Tax=Streptomyces klenkii TaxID=1420899 RepID=A0A3B0AZP3_9ACTN|nr:hypothetical protein D7231_24435 [Streptomyces klenkii]
MVKGRNTASSPVKLRKCETGEIHEHLAEARRPLTGTITVAPYTALHPTDKWIRYVITHLLVGRPSPRFISRACHAPPHLTWSTMTTWMSPNCSNRLPS